MIQRAVLTLASVLILTGCGGGPTGPETVPVSGKVTLDGEPLVDAVVTFSTEEFTGSGRTGEDGTYELLTGAVTGENKVWIQKFVAPEGFSEDPESGMDQGQLEAMQMSAPDPSKSKVDLGEQVPEKYSNAEQTVLTIVVSDGGTDSADFELSTSGD